MRGPAHVLLHEAHALGALDVQAPRVEAHALAHDGEARVLRVAPVELQQARRPRGGPAHGMDGGEALREELVAHPLVELGAEEVGLLAHHVRELRRAHVLGRRVHEVAHELHRFGEPERLDDPGRAFQLQVRGLAARLAVAGELVAAQRPAEGGLVLAERHRPLAERVAAGGELERQVRERPRVVGVAHARDHQLDLALAPGHRAVRVAPALEVARLHPAPLRGGELLEQPGQALRVGGEDGRGGLVEGLAVGDDGHGWGGARR